MPRPASIELIVNEQGTAAQQGSAQPVHPKRTAFSWDKEIASDKGFPEMTAVPCTLVNLFKPEALCRILQCFAANMLPHQPSLYKTCV